MGMTMEESDDIGFHLRRHIHLTNCIHLKNHIHRRSPVLADISLMKELSLLQRSRSLKDPSTSSPPWNPVSRTATTTGSSFTRAGMGKVSHHGSTRRRRRRSSIGGFDEPKHGRMPSSSSLPLSVGVSSKVSPCRLLIGEDESIDRGNISVRKHLVKSAADISVNSDPSSERSENHTNLWCLKTLSEQFNNVRLDDPAAANFIASLPNNVSDEVKPIPKSQSLPRRRRTIKMNKKGGNSLRKSHASVYSGAVVVQNEGSMAANSLARAAWCSEEATGAVAEDYPGQSVTARGDDNGNGCGGLHWNWSRIHNRGKSILDMAGRSLSCGVSDPRPDKGCIPDARGNDALDNASVYDNTTSSSISNYGEVLPLLMEASGSHCTSENSDWIHSYYGELGIFSEDLSKHGGQSEHFSESAYMEQSNPRRKSGRHQTLTRKYMPTKFRDVVGQSLVVQALTNAVAQKKVGMLYVFYGPHGTGKSSCARIFARALNCLSRGLSKPCGFCDSCLSQSGDKNQNIWEIGTLGNFDSRSFVGILGDAPGPLELLRCRVFIFDECDSFPHEFWNVMIKVIERAPRNVVFIFVCSSLELLPPMLVCRSQKFPFPKLKDVDILCALEGIVVEEDLEIDTDALNLIASKSDGSLRDAEMTLEQLSLLGMRISVPLVQELAGLISTEKMVDLLDLAMSADTVNTVKYLREIMNTGVEPLSLMSQLAAIVTDILGGNFNFINQKCKRKFFRHQKISKDDMEKLRQALKTLSEAEKQMRMSSDKSTWLTAAILQLAPDQQCVPTESIKKQYGLPGSSYSSLNRNPKIGSASDHDVDHDDESSMIRRTGGYDNSHIKNFNCTNITPERKRTIAGSVSDDEIQEIWYKVLQRIQDKELKDFLCREGRLASIRPASIVELVFGSHQYKSKAEKLRGRIIKAFETVIESPVVVEITHQSLICLKTMDDPSLFQFSDGSLCQPPKLSNYHSKQRKHDCDINTFGKVETRLPVSESSKPGHCEIVEVASSSPGVRGGSLEDQDHGGYNNFIGNVRLEDMIQQTEGSRRRSGWSRGRAVSIAEKLEQGIVSVEPRPKSLLCWKRCRNSRHKLCKLRWRKAPCSLLRYVFCGRRFRFRQKKVRTVSR